MSSKIENILRKRNIGIDDKDPAFIIVELISQLLDEHISDVDNIVKEAKDVLPYLLELKRQEIDNVALKLVNAGELLHIEQQKKSEIIYSEVKVKVENHMGEYVNQASNQLTRQIQVTLEDEVKSVNRSLHTLAKELNRQLKNNTRSKQLDLMVFIIIGMLCGLIGGLSVRLF